MHDILYALWLFLPAGAANVTPILVTRMPYLEKWTSPIDFGCKFRGHRLFGPNKTWRGLITGTFIAILTFILQHKIAPELGNFSNYLMSVGYMELPVVLGFLLGFGALAGDALESFFKRQRGIRPGGSWPAFDQMDYIIGSSLFAAVIIILPLHIYVWVFIIWFVMHLMFSYIGYRTGLKKTAI